MAIFKYINETYTEKLDQINLITYIFNNKKTFNKQYTGGHNISLIDYDVDYINLQFNAIRSIFQENNYSHLFHFILAFEEYYSSGATVPPKESTITMNQANDFASDICSMVEEFNNRQIIWAVHYKSLGYDMHQIHIHFVANPIDLNGNRLICRNNTITQISSQIFQIGHLLYNIDNVINYFNANSLIFY